MNRACRGAKRLVTAHFSARHFVSFSDQIAAFKSFSHTRKCLKTLTYDYEIQILEFVEENRINDYADYWEKFESHVLDEFPEKGWSCRPLKEAQIPPPLI